MMMFLWPQMTLFFTFYFVASCVNVNFVFRHGTCIEWIMSQCVLQSMRRWPLYCIGPLVPWDANVWTPSRLSSTGCVLLHCFLLQILYNPATFMSCCNVFVAAVVLSVTLSHRRHRCWHSGDDSRRNCLLAVIQTARRGYTWHLFLFFLSLFPHRLHVSFSLFFFARCPRSLWHYATLISSFNK